MGEKKLAKRYNSFRSLFISWRSNFNFFRGSSGFTLVELLTVVGILGILIVAALLIVDPISQIQKANDAKRKADLSQIQKSLETYFQDSGKYPQRSSSSPLYRIIRLDGTTADWGQQFNPYMSVLPKDPRKNYQYIYYTDSNRQKYYLYASLEKSNDRQLCNSGNPCSSIASNGIADNACGGICNFGVSSSNTNP